MRRAFLWMPVAFGQSITVSFAFFEKEFCTVTKTSRKAFNADRGRQMVTPN
jgi:hypothetical protein